MSFGGFELYYALESDEDVARAFHPQKTNLLKGFHWHPLLGNGRGGGKHFIKNNVV